MSEIDTTSKYIFDPDARPWNWIPNPHYEPKDAPDSEDIDPITREPYPDDR